MTVFTGFAPAQVITGLAADFDVLLYSRDDTGIVVDLVDATNNTGFAAGDVITSIERFVFGDGNDVFVAGPDAVQVFGGVGDDELYGGAADDDLRGGNGSDTISGGAGVDELQGGNGDDMFIITEAGGPAAGDRYNGGADNDTIVAAGGGTVNLTGATLVSIENIVIQRDAVMDTVLEVEDDTFLTSISGFGTGGQAIVNLAEWTGGEYDAVQLFAFLDPAAMRSIDAVTWEQNSPFDFSATFSIADGLVEVLIEDETDVRSFTTITNSFRADGTLAKQVQVFDDGREATKTYDATGTIETSTTLDLDDNFGYLSTTTLFAGGVRAETAVVADNGVTTTSSFDAGGVITNSLAVDIDGNTSFATIATTYTGGVISERIVDYDTHPSLDEIVTTYDATGTQEQSVRTFLNGTIQHIGVGAADNTFQSTTADDIFMGKGGVDTFVFNELTGDDRISDFDTADELIDLSAFGISTVADLQANATLTDQTNGNLLIDFTAGDTLTLNGVAEADLSDTNFV